MQSHDSRIGGGGLAPRLPGSSLALLGMAMLVGVLPACGSKQQTPAQATPLGAQMSWGMGNLDRSRCQASGKQVVTADTNQDGKPDIWKLYTQGASGQVLSCRQVDLNRDGKVDLVEHFDETGQLTMAEYDFDFDGKFDQTEFRVNGKVVRKERDLDFDGRPDHIEYYEAEKLVRIEIDNTGNGRVDEWQYYEDGKLDRIGYDTKGTGKADRWDRAGEETAAVTGGETGSSATP